MRRLVDRFQTLARGQAGIGELVHGVGLLLALVLIVRAVGYAVAWQDKYGALALLSGCLYAVAVYTVGWAVRHYLMLKRASSTTRT